MIFVNFSIDVNSVVLDTTIVFIACGNLKKYEHHDLDHFVLCENELSAVWLPAQDDIPT